MWHTFPCCLYVTCPSKCSIHLEGGEYCGVIYDEGGCSGWSKSSLGSSKYWPTTAVFSGFFLTIKSPIYFRDFKVLQSILGTLMIAGMDKSEEVTGCSLYFSLS